jgi:hypothetical protein
MFLTHGFMANEGGIGQKAKEHVRNMGEVCYPPALLPACGEALCRFQVLKTDYSRIS